MCVEEIETHLTLQEYNDDENDDDYLTKRWRNQNHHEDQRKKTRLTLQEHDD